MDDATYYKKLYETVCSINDKQFKRIELYHNQFMVDQAEIRKLNETINILENEIKSMKGEN